MPDTFTRLKLSLVPPDFKECYDIHENFSNFIKKVPTVNSEILVHMKNIESPETTININLRSII